MQLLITGATSPRGQATIAAALRHGHSVHAVLSPVETQPYRTSLNPRLTWLNIDWLEESGQEGTAALRGVDAVIHIDEVQSGPFERHYLGTVQTTERLVQAMMRNQVRRLVLASSLTVYNYERLAVDQLLDETCALESAIETRSAYTQAKLMQEALLCSFKHCWGGQVTLLRCGYDHGLQQPWQPALGLVDEQLSSTGRATRFTANSAASQTRRRQRYLQVSPQASFPLLYAEHFAEAAIASLAPIAIGETFNLVDDHLPSRISYSRALAKVAPTLQAVPMPWSVAQAAAQLQRRTKLTLPWLLQRLNPRMLNASFKPLRYSNIKAKRMLNWRPEIYWQDALRQETVNRAEPLSESVILSRC